MLLLRSDLPTCAETGADRKRCRCFMNLYAFVLTFYPFQQVSWYVSIEQRFWTFDVSKTIPCLNLKHFIILCIAHARIGEINITKGFIIYAAHLIIRVLKSIKRSLAEYGASTGKKRNALSSIRNTQKRTPLGRFRHRWEENIKTGFKELECQVLVWTSIGLC